MKSKRLAIRWVEGFLDFRLDRLELSLGLVEGDFGRFRRGFGPGYGFFGVAST